MEVEAYNIAQCMYFKYCSDNLKPNTVFKQYIITYYIFDLEEKTKEF